MIKPALTPKEWDSYPNWPYAKPPEGAEMPLYYPTMHGIAAANLHGQSFGFTHEDVALERAATRETPVTLEGGYKTSLVCVPIEVYPDCVYELQVPKRVWTAWCDRADRIAALLKPSK